MAGSSPFADAFGRLIAQLRIDPDDPEPLRQLLAQASVAVAREPVVEEAGIQLSGMLNDTSLRGRMHARRVEVIRIAAGAPADDLLALARALAQDDGEVPSTEAVSVDLVHLVQPGGETGPSPSQTADVGGGPDTSGGVEQPDPPALEWGRRDRPRAPRVGERVAREIEALQATIAQAAERGAWMEAIHAAQALVRQVPQLPEAERGGASIQIRRLLDKGVLQRFIEVAIRSPEEQSRVGEVLSFGGREAIEAMVESIAQTETSSARGFLHDALVATPDSFPQVLPLLQSRRATVVRHAAELLGRVHNPQAIPALLAQLDHEDARVRSAVLNALATFEDARAFEALRQALRHESPDTRGEAALAIGASGRTALGMPLLAQLEQERDAEAWASMVRALARIDAPEAAGGLVTIALAKKGLLRRGHSLAQRLEVVGALADGGTAAAAAALRRLVREGGAEIAGAAREALAAMDQPPQPPS